jgi:hypothetical protein
LAALRAIATWEVSQLAHLIERLSRIEEGEGTVLDHSIVVLSSEIGDGDRHNHDDLPLIAAGRGAGSLLPGRHVRFEEPLANLHLSLLHAMDVPALSFGDSTRALELK